MSQPRNIYIASCDPKGGVYQYRIDGNGVWQSVGFTPMDRPMYLAAHENTMYVILRAPFDNDHSGLITYETDADGRLRNPSAIASTKGIVACHHAIVDGCVYGVNYLSGNVIKMPDTVAEHHGSSVHPTRQTAPHTHFVCAAPDDAHLLVTDLGLDKIFVYDKDLNSVSDVDLPQGHGPRHLALHKDGKTVFCVNELRSTVSILEYEAGHLHLRDTVSVLPADCTVESTAAAIRCIGDRVYVSNRGHDSVSVLRFCDGQLSLEKTVPTYGQGPRDIWVEGDWLIATNEVGNNVCCVSLSDGCLLSEIRMKSPLCVLCR